MLCEKVLGNLADDEWAAAVAAGATVDYVDVDWHEAFKKLHRKVSLGGREVGVRLGDWVLSRGLSSGDVLGVEEGADGEKTLVAVRLLPTKCLVIDVDAGHAFMLARVGWEVGNTHTPLFWGKGGLQLLCEYTEPVERLLAGLHGVTVTAGEKVLDPARRVSASAHVHPHGGHDHGDGGHAHGHGDGGHAHPHPHDGHDHGDHPHPHDHGDHPHPHDHGDHPHHHHAHE